MIGKNIKLRALEHSDLDRLYIWENDPQLWHLSNTFAPFSRYVLEQYILNSHQDIYTIRQLRLMIDWVTAPQVPETVGSIDLFDFDPHHLRAGVGIFIAKAFQNKKLATEALDILKEYCFKTLKLNQLFCNIESDNAISLKLFQNAGFEICGCKKKWNKRNDIWMDEWMLQLLR